MWLTPAMRAYIKSSPQRAARKVECPRVARQRCTPYTATSTTAAFKGSPARVWVSPRWCWKPTSGPRRLKSTSMSGSSAASVVTRVAYAVLRFSPARPIHAPVRRCVTGSKALLSVLCLLHQLFMSSVNASGTIEIRTGRPPSNSPSASEYMLRAPSCGCAEHLTSLASTRYKCRQPSRSET